MKTIMLSMRGGIKPAWPELEATVFRYSSPRWLAKYRFILNRTETREQTINPREFRVSEYKTGASVACCYHTRNLAKAKGKEKLIELGERFLIKSIKAYIKNNGIANP